VTDLVGKVQVGDARAHEARLADPRSEGEAERRELALEVLDLRELGPDRRESGRHVLVLLQGKDFSHPCQDLERLALGRTQGKAAGDGADVAVHASTSRSKRGRVASAFSGERWVDTRASSFTSDSGSASGRVEIRRL